MTTQIAAISETTITVAVPLTVRARNGRPKMVLPAADANETASGPDPKLLRAIARAWLWRRRLEAGEVATIDDIAREEGVTGPYVGRTLRLAYMAPRLLEQLVLGADAVEASIQKLTRGVTDTWTSQQSRLR